MAIDLSRDREVKRRDGTRLSIGARFRVCPAFTDQDLVTSSGDTGAKGSIVVVVDQFDKPVTNPILWVNGTVTPPKQSDNSPPAPPRTYHGYFRIRLVDRSNADLPRNGGKPERIDIQEIIVSGSRYQCVNGERVLLVDIPEHYLEEQLSPEEVQALGLPEAPM